MASAAWCAVKPSTTMSTSILNLRMLPQHDPAGIVLLCISCHGKKTRGFLSKQTIAAARQNPKCKETGFSFEEFDIGTAAPEITVGGFTGTNLDTLIEIFGTKVLSISAPAEAHMPFSINALVTDRNGNTILRIEDNEWQSSIENWDVETGGGKITIRHGPGDIILVIRSEPPNKLIFERLDMYHQGTSIRSREGQLISITMPNGMIIEGSDVTADGCEIGIKIDARGLAFGVGGGSVSFGRLSSGPRIARRMSSAGKLSRNSLCSCGSGKKFKHCHGRYEK